LQLNFFDPNASKRYIRAISNVISSKSRQEELRALGKKTVCEKLSWELVAKKTLDIYKTLYNALNEIKKSFNLFVIMVRMGSVSSGFLLSKGLPSIWGNFQSMLKFQVFLIDATWDQGSKFHFLSMVPEDFDKCFSKPSQIKPPD